MVAPGLLVGISMCAGVIMRYGSEIKKAAWKGLLGRYKYEIIFGNLSGKDELDIHCQIRRLFRWIASEGKVISDSQELMRYGLKERDGTITNIRLPIESFTFSLDGNAVWATMLREPSGLIRGFEFWTHRWGRFSSGDPAPHFQEMMTSIDSVIDGVLPKNATDPLELTRLLAGNAVPKPAMTLAELDNFLKLSFEGNGKISNNLGCMFSKNDCGVVKDLIKAEEFFRKASRQGNLYGTYNLANVLYNRGDKKEGEIYHRAILQREGETFLKSLIGSSTSASAVFIRELIPIVAAEVEVAKRKAQAAAEEARMEAEAEAEKTKRKAEEEKAEAEKAKIRAEEEKAEAEEALHEKISVAVGKAVATAVADAVANAVADAVANTFTKKTKIVDIDEDEIQTSKSWFRRGFCRRSR